MFLCIIKKKLNPCGKKLVNFFCTVGFSNLESFIFLKQTFLRFFLSLFLMGGPKVPGH